MTGGENRRRSFIKALRKQKIDREVHWPLYYRGTTKGEPIGWYKNLHQYSKNKIHCSCPMCSSKTSGKGYNRFKRVVSGKCYKVSDARKIQRLEYVDD